MNKCYICNKLHDRRGPRGGIRLFCSDKCQKERMIQWYGLDDKGRKRDKQGYVDILIDCKFVREHRYVFEKYLGRKLIKGEVIHHRNGNKSDNRLENLQLLTNSTHSSGIETKHSEDIHRLLMEIKKLDIK